MQPAAPLSTPTTATEQLRAAHRSERLNLLNHPLQIQLATGALPYGSFVRLCHDRTTILDAVRSAAAAAQDRRFFVFLFFLFFYIFPTTHPVLCSRFD